MNRILRGNAKAARGLKSDKMNLSPIAFGLAFAALATAAPSHAATINHANITGGASSFTSADGKLTLTPFAAGGGAGVFGATSGCCMGVNGGANNGGVDDIDGSPITTGDRERMDIDLASDAGLTTIGFIFTRADGPLPTDGIVISGFASDPAASLDPAAAAVGVTANYNSGALYVNHAWRGGAVSVVSFGNLAASLGQIISVGANDSNEIRPQVVVNSMSYETIPEPSTLLLAGLAAVFAVMKRKG